MSNVHHLLVPKRERTRKSLMAHRRLTQIHPTVPAEFREKISKNKINPENSKIEQSTFLEHSFVFRSKYQDVWKRARSRLLAVLLLKKNIKTLHTEEYSPPENFEFKRSVSSLRFVEALNENLEKTREPVPCGIIHPDHKFRTYWDLAMLFVLLYTATIMPFSMAFVDSTLWDTWFLMDLIVNMFFIVDLVVNLMCAYITPEGKLVTSRWRIFLKYLKSWLIIDLVSSIPYSLLPGSNTDSSGSYNSSMSLLKLPRLYRLFRISRVIKLLKKYKNSEFMEKLQDFFDLKQNRLRLITTALTVALCVHIATCMWYFSAKLEGFYYDTWVFRNGLMNEDTGTLYLTSLYWAITTLSTVGYGDIHAQTITEKMCAIIWMIFTVYVFSFVIGSLGNMLSTVDSKENVLINKLAVIDEFAKEASLEKDLKHRLRIALRYSTEKTGFSWADKQNIFNELPKNFRYEVAMAMHRGAAKDLTFFADKDQVVVASIVPFLQPVFAAGTELVYDKGEFADEIYFVVKGNVSYVFGKDNKLIRSTQRGGYFGDIEVVSRITRKYAALAVRDSELLIMGKALINIIMDEYPHIWDEIVLVAAERDNVNQKTIAEIEVLNAMKNKGDLASIDMEKYKKEVDRFITRMKYKDLKKKINLDPKKPSLEDVTINDMNDKIESIFKTIEALEVQIKDLGKNAAIAKSPGRPKLPPIFKRGSKSPSVNKAALSSTFSTYCSHSSGEDPMTSLI
ncbi:unnamed protein product [Blepharisma stoltei]|uniref:Cyclic nucleotide-binding domain-containing protein n=1 Tax=Blepharisma stoltei TaxID=1481888 RepID=A0AAU9IIJ8_9CILI|nr:unnamed protein product [Blepharisma stoltei]